MGGDPLSSRLSCLSLALVLVLVLGTAALTWPCPASAQRTCDVLRISGYDGPHTFIASDYSQQGYSHNNRTVFKSQERIPSSYADTALHNASIFLVWHVNETWMAWTISNTVGAANATIFAFNPSAEQAPERLDAGWMVLSSLAPSPHQATYRASDELRIDCISDSTTTTPTPTTAPAASTFFTTDVIIYFAVGAAVLVAALIVVILSCRACSKRKQKDQRYPVPAPKPPIFQLQSDDGTHQGETTVDDIDDVGDTAYAEPSVTFYGNAATTTTTMTPSTTATGATIRRSSTHRGSYANRTTVRVAPATTSMPQHRTGTSSSSTAAGLTFDEAFGEDVDEDDEGSDVESNHGFGSLASSYDHESHHSHPRSDSSASALYHHENKTFQATHAGKQGHSRGDSAKAHGHARTHSSLTNTSDYKGFEGMSHASSLFDWASSQHSSSEQSASRWSPVHVDRETTRF